MNLRCAEKGTVDGGTGEIKAREANFAVAVRPVCRTRKRSKAPHLRLQVICNTLCDMRNAVTIRLDQDLERTLDQFCRRSKRKRSEVVRDALRRQLSLMTFEQLRHKAMPFAEARGFLTDEDVFKSVS